MLNLGNELSNGNELFIWISLWERKDGVDWRRRALACLLEGSEFRRSKVVVLWHFRHKLTVQTEKLNAKSRLD